jgi:HPt (histidine-containing phosphotransfer) domain-containing protein
MNRQELPTISNYLHDEKLVNKLRADFLTNQKNIFQNIVQSINTNDIETAHRLAHSLKGLAGLIHEPVLTQIAEHLEFTLKNEENPSPADLSALENELSRVMKFIEEPVTIPEPTVVVVADSQQASALFEKLEPLLAKRNSDALELIPQLKTLPETALLVKQIEDYDFVAALKTLAILNEILITHP